MKEYLVVYEQAEDGGWGAHSPDVDCRVDQAALGANQRRVAAGAGDWPPRVSGRPMSGVGGGGGVGPLGTSEASYR